MWILTSACKKNYKMCSDLDFFFVEFCHVLSRFYLCEGINDPDSDTRIAIDNLIMGFWIKKFQEIIYLPIVHSYEHDCENTAREIFRNGSDGLLAFEFTLKNWSVAVQYMFHCHSRILQCATFFPITRALNTAWMKFDAFIYTFYPRWKKVSKIWKSSPFF